jgi:hypothetical protein
MSLTYRFNTFSNSSYEGIYFFWLLDHKGQQVMRSDKYYVSSKQCAFNAWKEVENTPPCCGIKIFKRFITASDVVNLLNNKIK